MRIARLDTPEGPRHAVWTGDVWEVVEDWLAEPPVGTGVSVAPEDAHLLAPCEPRVLVGIAHNKTNNDHVLPIQAWHKSVRSVVSPNAVIQARRDVGTVNIEGELAVVIGRDTEGITVDTVFDYVLGYTVVNDVTNVDRNTVDEKNFEGKGGHGYTPIGPWIETELNDPEHVVIMVTVNGTVKADLRHLQPALDRRREHRLRCPLGPTRARRRDHERLTQHFRRSQSGRHCRDQPVRGRLAHQPCRMMDNFGADKGEP